MSAPQGTVQLFVDGNVIPGATGTLDSSGQCVVSLPTVGLSVGIHNVTAQYTPAPGSPDLPSESGGEGLQIDPATFPTHTSTSFNPNEVQQGTPVPVTVTVAT